MATELININLDDKEVTVSKAQYIKAKTNDLRAFGYETLTEKDVESQLDNVLKGKTLNVIGMFIEKDIIKP